MSERKNIIITIIVGLIANAISFIYYYSFKSHNEIVLLLISIIDISLFFRSSYIIVSTLDKKKITTVLFSILLMIGYFAFSELIVLLFSFGTSINFTLDLAKEVYMVTLFASPSIIILVPVIWFIAECLS